MTNENVIFAVTHHGGHLGFYEGGLIYPDTITWLDKIVVQYADAIVDNIDKTTADSDDVVLSDDDKDSGTGNCMENGELSSCRLRESAY